MSIKLNIVQVDMQNASIRALIGKMGEAGSMEVAARESKEGDCSGGSCGACAGGNCGTGQGCGCRGCGCGSTGCGCGSNGGGGGGGGGGGIGGG